MPTRRQLDPTAPTSEPPDLRTVAETAAVLRCGLTFVYESIHRYRATGDGDEIPGPKVGRSLRVPRVAAEGDPVDPGAVASTLSTLATSSCLDQEAADSLSTPLRDWAAQNGLDVKPRTAQRPQPRDFGIEL
jgi:hypothetical protein